MLSHFCLTVLTLYRPVAPRIASKVFSYLMFIYIYILEISRKWKDRIKNWDFYVLCFY